MGFDVTGLDPASKNGRYFGRNVWGWHPLWRFVCLIGDDLLSAEQKRKGHSNDFMTVDKETSLEIARRLRKALDHREGCEDRAVRTEIEVQLERKYLVGGLEMLARKLEEEPGVVVQTGDFRLDWGSLSDFAEFCESCGGFIIT